MATRRKLLTAEDVLNMPEDDFRYELLDGVLVKMSPPGNPHGLSQATISAVLFNFVHPHGLGRVFGEIGFILHRNPDRVRAPDVCFIARERIPAEGLGRGFIDFAPDLAVEILSPSDRRGEVEEKAQEWLRFGTRIVWLVRTAPRTVTVYEPGQEPRLLTEADTLTAEPVLSGFSVPVRALFS
jgi:Uma2 family endonuclease